jgi:hypothetical protein
MLMVNAEALEIPLKNRCRQIERSDLDAVADLLTRGFPSHTPLYWRRVLSRLGARATPAGYPKYGYLLETGRAPVGVILLIFVVIEIAGVQRMRCYLSSWYVEPAYRSYASLLVSAAMKHRNVTYVNVSPDPRTWPIIEAQGFSRYCGGQYRAVPLLSLRSDTGQVRQIQAADAGQACPGSMPEMLTDHAGYGCLSLVCTARDGEYSFIFQVRRIGRGLLPCAQLIYCRDIVDVVRFARPLGAFLSRHGIFCISADSNGKVQGLVGKYFEGRAPKYFKGPDRPRPGDLAYTEAVLLEA